MSLKIGTVRRIAALLLGLLVFAVGHTFLLPEIALASSGAAHVHHDVTPHEDSDDHFSCPNDIHQPSYNRDQQNFDNLSDISAVNFAIEHFCDLVQLRIPTLEIEEPHIGIPLDQKIVLLV